MKKRIYGFLNLVVIAFVLILPYYIFEGKSFIGGDDTRLFYSYPSDFLRNLAYFSWASFSSLSSYLPNHQSIPLLSLLYILDYVLPNGVYLSYLTFSLPLVLGFIFFQKMILELVNQVDDSIVLISSLIYIFSPIMLVNQLSVFLTPVWLLGLMPILFYYFSLYYKTSSFIHIYKSMIWSFILSIGLYATPWFLGFILPLISGLLVSVLFFSKSKIIHFIKKLSIFTIFILCSQPFWLIPFIATFLFRSGSNLGSTALSSAVTQTFIPTVQSTATGNVLYPLLHIFHRQIAIDFDWLLKNIFTNFYDRIFFLHSVFIIVFFLGIFHFKWIFNNFNRKIFLLFVVIFVFSLFLFTVNIGPLKYIFYLFGYLPGFVMFRNFYDKFALGYVFFYTIVLTYSLVVVKKKNFRIFIILYFWTLSVILLNLTTIKNIVNNPLWTTKSVYKTANIPKEYWDVIDYIKENITSSNTILTLPFNNASYSVITDDKNHAYVGTSPVKFFSGVNDISGEMSLPNHISGLFVSQIRQRKYKDLALSLEQLNINYILLTKNIPSEVRRSYLYEKKLLELSEESLINEIGGKKIYTSSQGNYEIYTVKKPSSVLSSENLYFQRLSPVKYRLFIKNITSSQELFLKESFHPGWKILLQKSPNKSWCNKVIAQVANSYECDSEFSFFDIQDIFYSFSNSLFTNVPFDIHGNKWNINPNVIRAKGNDFYSSNKDGSINAEFVIYFLPQNYFYFSFFLTLTLFMGSTYLFYKTRHNK